jgi:uncharacterized protein YrzB (UPF0473 family)
MKKEIENVIKKNANGYQTFLDENGVTRFYNMIAEIQEVFSSYVLTHSMMSVEDTERSKHYCKGWNDAVKEMKKNLK